MIGRVAVVVFPGSNCDHDAYNVVKHVMGNPAELVWHRESDLSRFDAIILPGGFAHGDYLRTGAIARFSPVMKAVAAAAAEGKPVLGICNGFQILVEAGLLPGALLRNTSLKFICRQVHIRVETERTPFTRAAKKGAVLKMPIAHNEGNYFCEASELQALESEGRVVFRYCDAAGQTTPESNPNGSMNGIAGICSAGRNVVGLMPHPERASEPLLGSSDGRVLFESLVTAGLAAAGR